MEGDAEWLLEEADAVAPLSFWRYFTVSFWFSTPEKKSKAWWIPHPHDWIETFKHLLHTVKEMIKKFLNRFGSAIATVVSFCACTVQSGVRGTYMGFRAGTSKLGQGGRKVCNKLNNIGAAMRRQFKVEILSKTQKRIYKYYI